MNTKFLNGLQNANDPSISALTEAAEFAYNKEDSESQQLLKIRTMLREALSKGDQKEIARIKEGARGYLKRCIDSKKSQLATLEKSFSKIK